jgi:hypothetical protein
MAGVKRFLEGAREDSEMTFRIDEATKDPWNRRLPDDLMRALKGVSIEDLNVSRKAIFTWLGDLWGALLESRIAEAKENLLEGDNPIATVIIACNPQHAKEFGKYLKSLQASTWGEIVDKALSRLRNRGAEVKADGGSEVSRDSWPPPLPDEFKNIEVAGSASYREVQIALQWLGQPAQTTPWNWGTNFFRDPSKVLSAVMHIHYKPRCFKQYEGIIQPNWNTWIQTARRALPLR